MVFWQALGLGSERSCAELLVSAELLTAFLSTQPRMEPATVATSIKAVRVLIFVTERMRVPASGLQVAKILSACLGVSWSLEHLDFAQRGGIGMPAPTMNAQGNTAQYSDMSISHMAAKKPSSKTYDMFAQP